MFCNFGLPTLRRRLLSEEGRAREVLAAMKYVAKCLVTDTGFAEEFFSKFAMPTVRAQHIALLEMPPPGH